MALSLVKISDVFAELEANPDFAALSDAEKLQAANSAQEDERSVCEINNLDDYRTNNLEFPIVGGGGIFANVRVGSGVATVAGVPILFSSPMDTGLDIDPDPLLCYHLDLQNGVSFINPDTGDDTRTSTGFTAYAAVEDTPFSYEAIDPV